MDVVLGVTAVFNVQLVGAVDGDRFLHLAEQLLEVDDVAVVLVVAVEPICAADGLKQVVVVQLVVEVDVRAARRIEAGQQLADDDQQLHVRRFLNEAALGFVLVLIGGLALLEDVLRVGVELVALVTIRGLLGDRRSDRLVGGNDPAVRSERCVLQQPIVVAGVVDRCRDQDRRATVVVQPRLEAEVLDDVGDDALLAFAGTHQLLHRRPALAQDRLLEVVQSLGFLLEPLVDGGPGREPLRHVAGLVFEVQDDAVGYALVELVGVDVGAEDVPRHQLVAAKERGAGEADEDRALQPALHLLVHISALCAMALVHEDVEAALHGWGWTFQVGHVELVDERA